MLWYTASFANFFFIRNKIVTVNMSSINLYFCTEVFCLEYFVVAMQLSHLKISGSNPTGSSAVSEICDTNKLSFFQYIIVPVMLSLR